MCLKILESKKNSISRDNKCNIYFFDSEDKTLALVQSGVLWYDFKVVFVLSFFLSLIKGMVSLSSELLPLHFLVLCNKAHKISSSCKTRTKAVSSESIHSFKDYLDSPLKDTVLSYVVDILISPGL